MSNTLSAAVERVEVIGAQFTIVSSIQSEAPDEAGVLVALDKLGDERHVLGVRPLPTVFDHPLGERWREDWNEEAEGAMQFAWCPAPFDDEEFSAALAYHIACAIEDAYRRGERLEAGRVA